MDRETPRSVMFDDLRKFGGITNRDTAWMLLRSTPMAGGKAPRDRVDERAFLSREVVHAPVERPRPELFADITQTAQNITARLISNLGGSEMARAMVAEHYSGEAADTMRESLSAYGLDDRGIATPAIASPRPAPRPPIVHYRWSRCLWRAVACAIPKPPCR